MDKQKKQILLLVLVVALGGGLLLFLYKDKIFSKAPPPGPAIAADSGAPPPPAPGQPDPNAQPGGMPGQPAAPLDEKMPELKLPDVVKHSVEYKVLRDPLKVLDTDASYPLHQKEVQMIRETWRLTGIAIMGKEIVKTYKRNEDGSENPEPVIIEREIWACFFANNPKYYREGDRLEGTHFVVKTIHHEPDGAYVEIEGDMGLRVKLQMITNDRYK